VNRPGKIVCVGRNYLEHARELGNEVPKEPLLFLKPPSSVVAGGAPIVLPRASRQVEHEGEIGVVLARALRRASRDEARAAIAGVSPRTTSPRATCSAPTVSRPAPRGSIASVPWGRGPSPRPTSRRSR
jgi:hypothetical protein